LLLKISPKSHDVIALRASTITWSLVDLTVNIEATVTKDEVNKAIKAIKSGSQSVSLKWILKYVIDPIASTDIIHDFHSSIFDSKLTKVIPNKDDETLVKILS
jgi:glyceraldehyde 3-phosphate dehydrogenase